MPACGPGILYGACPLPCRNSTLTLFIFFTFLMPEHQAFPYLREILLFLSLAGILIPLLQRLRVDQVLGFLIVGAVVGPFGLGLWLRDVPWLEYLTFSRVEGVAALAELGVLFMMFMIGLELSTERLWVLRRWVFGAGTAQVLLTAICIGAVIFVFGQSLEVATILGLVLALSSTAVVIQLMNQQRSLGSSLGQAGFSILMLQDLAVVPLLVLIGVMASGESANMITLVGVALLKSAVAIVVIYLLGRRVIRPLFRTLVKQRQPDVFMALTLLSSLGIAGLTAAAGLSMALGAFLAGLLLAETEFRHEVEVTIDPFKGLLMGLFFMSVGMGIDLRTISQAPLLVPSAVFGLLAIKAIVLALIFRIGGFNWGRAVEGGLLMGQGGEFAFIIIGYALTSKLIEPKLGQFVMLVVGLSLFATPFAAKGGRVFAEWWERKHPGHFGQLNAESAEHAVQGRVIIAGFGRIGHQLAQLLEAQGVAYIAIENDARRVAELHPQGVPIFFGDASRAELLLKVHAAQASAFVLTMDHPASALNATKVIHREYPDLPLFVRARDEKHAMALMKAGATVVIPETLESGLQLSASVLHTVGIDQSITASVIQVERDRRLKAFSTGGKR
ncbi:cation:proton antiporter [soil metagenome]